MDWTSPQAVTGLRGGLAVPQVASVTAQAAVGHEPGGLLHADNPLTWALGLGLVTFGLVAVSGSVRLGRAKVSASVGKTS